MITFEKWKLTKESKIAKQSKYFMGSVLIVWKAKNIFASDLNLRRKPSTLPLAVSCFSHRRLECIFYGNVRRNKTFSGHFAFWFEEQQYAVSINTWSCLNSHPHLQFTLQLCMESYIVETRISCSSLIYLWKISIYFILTNYITRLRHHPSNDRN